MVAAAVEALVLSLAHAVAGLAVAGRAGAVRVAVAVLALRAHVLGWDGGLVEDAKAVMHPVSVDIEIDSRDLPCSVAVITVWICHPIPLPSCPRRGGRQVRFPKNPSHLHTF